MREILFRGKRIDNGEWVEGFLIKGKKTYIVTKNAAKYMVVSVVSYMACVEFVEVIPETVGQYTGLTDKNGKKIFEGDICLVPLAMVCQRAVVEYNLRTANYDLRGKTFVVDFYNFFGEDCEVIGNIHDNPELLKGDKDNGNT